MKVNGRWLSIDPREWRNGYRTTVKVGLGTADKARELANLQLIGAAQEKLLAVGLVQPQNLYHTATMLAARWATATPDDFTQPAEPRTRRPSRRLSSFRSSRCASRASRRWRS